VSLGKRTLKNVGDPAEVYRVALPWEQSSMEAEYPVNRIAILPFTSFSQDPNDGFFADGMPEEIISTVSGLSGLNVISRTSVMGYKGTTKKVGEIGRELKVGSILEGSFRKAGNRIRVTTQLIDVAEDKHLWAQNYDRDLDDVFEVQSDVAKQVADALKVRILSQERERIESKPTASTAAYALYLKGRQILNQRGLDNLKKAAGLFEQAVREDPGFALGYVGKSDCAMALREWKIAPDANLANAKEMLAKALELDPGLAEEHTTKTFVLLKTHELRQAEAEFKEAIELKPSNATAHQWYYLLLREELRWKEASHRSRRPLSLTRFRPS
jgi:adenylate cyclase